MIETSADAGGGGAFTVVSCVAELFDPSAGAVPALWTAAVGCVGFVLVAVPAALRDTIRHQRPTGRTASELAWGVVGGWAKMLSVGLPTEAGGVNFSL